MWRNRAIKLDPRRWTDELLPMHPRSQHDKFVLPKTQRVSPNEAFFVVGEHGYAIYYYNFSSLGNGELIFRIFHSRTSFTPSLRST